MVELPITTERDLKKKKKVSGHCVINEYQFVILSIINTPPKMIKPHMKYRTFATLTPLKNPLP